MYKDKQLLICTKQECIGSTTTEYSDYTVDLSSTVGDIGCGAPLYMVICVTTAFTSGTSVGTVCFAVVTDPDTATCDTNSPVIVQTAPILVTTLTEGKVIVIPLPAGIITEQYLGLKATTAAEEVLTGKIDAFVALQPPLNP